MSIGLIIALGLSAAVFVALIVIVIVRGFHPKVVDLPFEFIPLFKGLAAGQQERIKALVTGLQVRKNVYIIKENATDNSLYYLVKGKVNILKSGSLYDNLLKEVNEDEFFGEMAFLNGSQRLASAFATEKSLLIRIDFKNYQAVIDILPEIKAKIWEAAELHTIMLCFADYPELRSLNNDQKFNWISQRKQLDELSKATTLEANFEWLALISGRIEVNQIRYNAPSLIRLSPSALMTPIEKCRISLLPKCELEYKKSG